ncbi:MAG TPA: methylmalonyl Co-A mutase-associated GTPase MeaB, partial [Rubrobacter sp.]|nr:methylmalonyl Co-A mutase-associated GTPase MeaB [Rubrobacter sp.]
MAEGLVERLLRGDRRALARVISKIEREDPETPGIVAEIYPKTGEALTVGFTGPPGVGKSSIIAKLIELYRKEERRVGVVSVDPSSPFSKGAILGDRIRLSDHFLDPGVFIRSMGSRGHLGGLAGGARLAGMAMEAAGIDVVLYETVGVGQGEVEVASAADTVVLALQPGAGDAVQALKAGVMEIADVFCINKADHPRAKGAA